MKTVKQLNEEVESIREDMGNVQVQQAICYHWEQVAATLEELDRYGELIKMEITHCDNVIGKRSYRVTTWHSTLLNKKDRKKMSGNYYSGLERTAQRYYPKKK